MRFVRRLVQLLGAVAPKHKTPHAWHYSDDAEHRFCTTCGCTETFDHGGGVNSPDWIVAARGRLSRHVVQAG